MADHNSWGDAFAGVLGGGAVVGVVARWLTFKKGREESVDSRFSRLIDELQKQLDLAHLAAGVLQGRLDALSEAHHTNAQKISELQRIVSDQRVEIARLGLGVCTVVGCTLRGGSPKSGGDL